MSKSNNKLLTVHYTVIQVLLNAIYLAVAGFASVFLRAKGIGDAWIGVILAIGTVLSVLTQPGLGSVADKSRRLGLNQLMAIFSVSMIIFALLLLVIGQSALAVAILFIALSFGMNVVMTFSNSLVFMHVSQDTNIDFGLARGIGSGGYAAASYVLGNVSGDSGEGSIMVSVIVLSVILIVVLLFFKCRRPSAEELADVKDPAAKSKTQNLFPFMRSNPRFCVFILGVAFLYFCHTIRANYMYQIALNVGCTVEQYGTMTSYTAFIEIPAMACFSLLLKRFRARTLMLFSAVCMIIRTVVYAFAGNLFWLYVGSTFQVVTFAMFVPASVYYVNEWIGKANVNKGQAFLGIGRQISTIFASLLGGVMLTINNGNPHTMLLSAAAVSVIGVVLLFCVSPKTEKASD